MTQYDLPSLKTGVPIAPPWYVELRMAFSPQTCHPIQLYGRVFRVGGSADAISGSIKFKVAAGH